ncbi:HATPase_UhpB-NarQ-NarX-like domain containing protein [Mycobacteriaceae bacterium]
MDDSEIGSGPADLIRRLTEDVDLLGRRLARERENRREAEQIAERTLRDLYQKQHEVAFLSAIATKANNADSVSEVLAAALEDMCRFTDWSAAHAYIAVGDGEERRMRPTGIWCRDPGIEISALRAATTPLAKGQCLPGRVWESGEPVWLEDLASSRHFHRLGGAQRSGLRTAFGVPVLVGSEVMAVLEFFGPIPIPEDSDLVGLIAQAGTQLGRVIEREDGRTRLLSSYAQTRARQAWIEATRDIATELLRGAEPGEAFRLIAQRAQNLSGADMALVAVPADAEGSMADVTELLVSETVGWDRPPAGGPSLPVANSAIGTAFTSRTPCRLDTAPDVVALVGDAGPAMVLPLRSTETVAGVVVVLKRRGAPEFTDEQLEMMATFTDQATLAWQLASTQHRMRELDVIADRERIARDLHDHVIQRLFAVGLSLQGTIPRARTPEVQVRLTDIVDELQGVIGEIRTKIFELHGGSSGATRLRQRLDEAIAGFSGSGLRTTARFSGPLSVVDATLADHAEAVLREAVSNAIRHAQANSLIINVRVEDDLSVEVIDDGCGMPPDVTASGLANLRARAAEAGGELVVTDAPGGGTHVRWSAPLT